MSLIYAQKAKQGTIYHNVSFTSSIIVAVLQIAYSEDIRLKKKATSILRNAIELTTYMSYSELHDSIDDIRTVCYWACLQHCSDCFTRRLREFLKSFESSRKKRGKKSGDL